jgi:hypothetical protein
MRCGRSSPLLTALADRAPIESPALADLGRQFVVSRPQINAQKRFSRGLQLNVAYTYSKSLGEGLRAQ